MNIHEFVNSLKQTKVFTTKQCIVIDNLLIYFNNLKVYKVIIAVNPNLMKKAKKLGLTSQYSTTFFDDVLITVPDVKNISKGRFIAIYNPNNGNCSIYEGEVTEQEQIEKFKRKQKL